MKRSFFVLGLLCLGAVAGFGQSTNGRVRVLHASRTRQRSTFWWTAPR